MRVVDLRVEINGWLATSTYVVPVDDLREHDAESDECWCCPSYDGDILVHNSADRRERVMN